MNPSKIFSKFRPIQPSGAVLQPYVTLFSFFTPIFEMHIILGLKLHRYYKDPPSELPYYGEDGNP
jgi:hypothetical protein